MFDPKDVALFVIGILTIMTWVFWFSWIMTDVTYSEEAKIRHADQTKLLFKMGMGGIALLTILAVIPK